MTAPLTAHARWPALLLAACLLLAQGLGLLHRVEHGGHAIAFGHAPGPAHEQGHEHGQAAGAVLGPRDDLLGGTLLPEHEPGSAECRLYDQLGWADSLPMAAEPAVTAVRSPEPPAAPVARAWDAACPAAYQARAPPLRA